MSACECLTVCGWVLCNYLPWLGFLFWVHSEKFHTEIVCTDKIEVESFWLLIYLPMRSVWWKSPGSAHNHTQSQAITHRVTPAHLHTHYTVSLSCTLAHLHTRPAFPNRPCEVSLPTRSAFLCKLCCYHHLRTCHSLAFRCCSRISSCSPSSASSSSALLITLISLCIVAVNWHCAWRALRCEADRAGQYELGLLPLLHLLLRLIAGFNVRVTQVCAHLLDLCLRRCRCVCVPLLMNENYKDALPCRSLCHRFAFNDTRTGYLLT